MSFETLFALLAVAISIATALALIVKLRRKENIDLLVKAVLRGSEVMTQVFEQAHDLIALLNKEGEIEYVSPGIKNVLGYTVNEYLTHYRYFIHPDDAELAKKNYRYVLENPGEPLHVEIRERHKEGHYVWLSGILINLLGADPINKIVANFHDDTERRQLVDSLQITNNELQATNDKLTRAYDSTLKGWAHALELRDYETGGHSDRVTDLAVRLAEYLGLTNGEVEDIRRGALLHDIGKMGIPDGILLKPDRLTDEEMEIIKSHPIHAYNMLKEIRFLENALDIPHYHHERWNGSGYPEGLKGEAIPFAARLFAVVDVYDALMSNRTYRSGMPKGVALEYIRQQSGSHFDPQIVTAFLEMIEKSGNN